MIKPACSVCLLLHFLQQNIKTCEQLTRNVKKKRAAEKQENFPSLNLSLSLSLWRTASLSVCKPWLFLSVTNTLFWPYSANLQQLYPTVKGNVWIHTHTHTHTRNVEESQL
jgi:hypothetical protein